MLFTAFYFFREGEGREGEKVELSWHGIRSGHAGTVVCSVGKGAGEKGEGAKTGRRRVRVYLRSANEPEYWMLAARAVATYVLLMKLSRTIQRSSWL